MLKSVLSFVAFTLAFGFSVILVGLLFGVPQTNFGYSKHSHANCHGKFRYDIERLINQDVKNGEMRNLDTRRLDMSEDGYLPISQYAEYVEEYVNKSQKMDDAGLPADFQNAWREHMKAWRDYSDFLNRGNNLKLEMSADEFNKYETKYNQEINRTWYKTLRIGRSYGAHFDL